MAVKAAKSSPRAELHARAAARGAYAEASSSFGTAARVASMPLVASAAVGHVFAGEPHLAATALNAVLAFLGCTLACWSVVRVSRGMFEPTFGEALRDPGFARYAACAAAAGLLGIAPAAVLLLLVWVLGYVALLAAGNDLAAVKGVADSVVVSLFASVLVGSLLAAWVSGRLVTWLPLVAAGERRAFRRAWRMTRGLGLKTFLLMNLVMLPSVGSGVAVSNLAAGGGEATKVVAALASAAIAGFGATAWAHAGERVRRALVAQGR